MSCGVLFKGLSVQKDTQTPCWLKTMIERLLSKYWDFLVISEYWIYIIDGFQPIQGLLESPCITQGIYYQSNSIFEKEIEINNLVE